ncbi:MAG: hypothetical protein IKX71_04340 [Bacteroidales bacterium]|nr:hypothetical protein [Bacteroidales bacterium]
MKKLIVVLMLALCFAGCHNQKKVYTQSDIDGEQKSVPDVDWIGLYQRCHELDSLKNILEASAVHAGQPLPALPDSVNGLWTSMLYEILLRHGENAFGLYDSHRADIEKYLRMDFLGYGFTTQVYLPYKATVSTREEYGVICIKELEEAMSKAEMTRMYTGQEPSHYEDVLKQLFHAYVNYEKYDEAAAFADIVLSYLRGKYGDESREYANMLKNKADVCGKRGSNYSAMVSGKQAVLIYDKLLADPNLDPEIRAKMSEDKKELEDNLQLWQGK